MRKKRVLMIKAQLEHDGIRVTKRKWRKIKRAWASLSRPEKAKWAALWRQQERTQ